VPITLTLIERMLKEYPGTVVGLKDSSGDWSNTKAVLDAFAGFGVFVGSEKFLLETLRGGGAGCISATANINGPAIARLYNESETPGADDLQRRCTAFRKAIARFPMIPALKATIAMHTDDPEWFRLRPPLVELSAEQRAGLAACLKDQSFEMPQIRAAA
jgi:4-hydroxy-tetrahydrodipicolinate synthase